MVMGFAILSALAGVVDSHSLPEKVIEYLPCGKEWNTNFENDIPLFLKVASIFKDRLVVKKKSLAH